MKETIVELLQEVLQELGINDIPPSVTRPDDPTHGEYSTNVAMLLTRQLRKSPMEIAEKIQEEIAKYQKQSKLLWLAKVEIASPGFINFFLSEARFISQIQEVLTQGQRFGTGRQPPEHRTNTATGKNGKQRIMIEFSDANPFKEFHIGHLRNITLGEAFSRLLEASGNEVRRVSYQGDVGVHVAKALWGMQRLEFRETSLVTPKQKAEFLGKAYAAGAKAYEENEKVKQEIVEINKKVYRKDASILPLWNEGRQWSLDYFDTIYDRVGTAFTRFYFESEVAPIGAAIVADHIGHDTQSGVFEESEGAVIFRGEKVGLHTRVFISGAGYPTYEAKDLALVSLKYSEYPYDLSIIMTANEQTEYFKVMLAALAQIAPHLAAKTKHISFGMVRLTEGKMSSRTGNVITAEWLIDQAKAKISDIVEKIGTNPPNGADYTKAQKDEIAEKAAIAAVKYSMLKVGASSDIAFDLEKSVSFEGDSGPYLQYTYARCKSVLRKAEVVIASESEAISKKIATVAKNGSLAMTLNLEEKAIARLLGYFPEIIEEAARGYVPNILCTYLFELAQAFNLLYAKHEIIGHDARMNLTAATAQVIKNGLYVLGIDVLEQM